MAHPRFAISNLAPLTTTSSYNPNLQIACQITLPGGTMVPIGKSDRRLAGTSLAFGSCKT